MRLIKVGAAVLNQTPLAWKQNAEHIREAIAQAKAAGVGILCLPELCISGYGCEDEFHSPGVWKTSWDILEELAGDTEGIIVSFGLPVFHHDSVFDAACLVADGKIVGFTAKRFLAGDGIHYEPRWFKPWPAGVQTELRMGGQAYPLGDLHFRCLDREGDGVKIGFEICEDAWVASRPGSQLARAGIDVILNPSASHFAFAKMDIRKRFVLEGSRAFGVSYVYANLLGNEAGRAIYDGGALIASSGMLLAAGPRFSFQDVHLTTAVVDIDLTRMNHARITSFVPDLTQPRSACADFEFELPAVGIQRLDPKDSPDFLPEPTDAPPKIWETGSRQKEEEFTRAMALALFDYLRKSYSHGFVVSLSGGADSAAVSTLVALMVKLGLADLGREQFIKKLGYIAGLDQAETPREIVERLLTTVYQSTVNSGDVTRNAAETLAEALGCRHYEFDVDPMVNQYVSTVSKALGRELTWGSDDIALQNIQARVRSPGAWMLANINNALLLATSNRSEAAVGYATMDGDTSGGLSPIAGIDKAFLRTWLSWMETEGPAGFGPLPALKAINVQQPTAELRPAEAGQTDEDDLMPYPLLDSVERCAIRDKQTPVECYQWMRAQFPQYSAKQLGIWIERFFRLWSRNQWKRERYAPSFHLDDKNLDPKTWCRFPILSGGFERELAELRAVVEKESKP
jgi:NAD+ synthase (glutamine-hydrolysing)